VNLSGRRYLVTGVLNEESLAFRVARELQSRGAELVLTSFGRPLRITERVAKRLPDPPQVQGPSTTTPLPKSSTRNGHIWTGSSMPSGGLPRTPATGVFSLPRPRAPRPHFV
jgi:hypothetical protein